MLFLLSANVHLLLQNRRLKTVAPSLDESVVVPQAILRGIGGVAPDGRHSLLTFREDGPRTVFVTFSAICPYSEANREFWLNLTRTADSKLWRIVWVSRDSIANTQAFAKKHRLEGLVLAEPGYRTYKQLGMQFIPQTIVVDQKGAVEDIWAGALSAAQKEAVQRRLSAVAMAAR